jgi:hypothetical protein
MSLIFRGNPYIGETRIFRPIPPKAVDTLGRVPKLSFCLRGRPPIAMPRWEGSAPLEIGLSLEVVPTHVRQFLSEHIHSVIQLEALLFLRGAKERSWSATELGRELRIEPIGAAAQLAGLCASTLLICDEGPEPRYQYKPPTAQLDEAVEGLAQAYGERPVAIITLIYSKPLDPIRGFADAFLFRKKDQNGG